jgi:hypothetical protein
MITLKMGNLSHKFKLALCASISFVLIIPLPVNAYDRDVHYYVTAMILADLTRNTKLSSDQKTVIEMNQYVDDNNNTLPSFSLTDEATEIRRKYHFPASRETGFFGNRKYGDTVRNSAFAKYHISEALPDDPVRLGMALHTYMDSFAHESYGAGIGHAAAGHDPDRPYLDTDKFRQMVRMVYVILNKWLVMNNIETSKQSITLDQYQQWAKYVPPGIVNRGSVTNVVDAVYELGEIIPREEQWKLRMKETFPGASLPDYSLPSASDKKRFEEKAARYSLPLLNKDISELLLGAAHKSGESMFAFNARDTLMSSWAFFLNTLKISEASAAPFIPDYAVELTDSDNEMIAGIKNGQYNVGEAAQYVHDHPNVYRDERLAKWLNTENGVTALMEIGLTSDVYMRQLVFFNSENIWGSWSAYNDTIADYLNDPGLKNRLITANLLSNNHPSQEICKKIDHLYASIDPGSLQNGDRQSLLETLNPNSEFISQCAPQTLTLLNKLLDYSDVAVSAAALLYNLGTDEERENLISDPTAVNAMRSIRNMAFTDLRNGGQVNIAPAAKSSAPSSPAKGSSEAIAYWQALSYEDFDSKNPSSPSDQRNQQKLATLLKQARQTKDTALAKAVASAAGTYRPEDNPPKALIDEINASLTDPNLQAVRAELGYAQEQVSGTIMDLGAF